MQQFKKITLVIISALFVAILGGCASPPPQRTSIPLEPTVPAQQELQKEQPHPESTQADKTPTKELQTEEQNIPASSQAEKSSAEQKPQAGQQPLTLPPLIGEPSPGEILPTPSLPSPAVEVLAPAGPQRVPADQADMEFIQHRIQEYQNKYDQCLEVLKTRHLNDTTQETSMRQVECFQTIEKILAGYRLLLEEMQKGGSSPEAVPGTDSPSKIEQLDIAYLESTCGELFGIAPSSVPQDGSITETPELSFDAAQKYLATHVAQENYQEALQDYANLSQNFPGLTPSLATELNYGRALQYTGQLEAAASHFSQLLASEELSASPLKLQLEIADLYLASGNVAAAESFYENLLQAHKEVEGEKSWAVEQLAFLRSHDPGSKDMAAYRQLLQAFESRDYRIHGAELNEMADRFVSEHAGEQIGVNGLRLKNFALSELHAWFDRQLLRIDSLIIDKKFTEASDILQNLTQYYLPADLQSVVQKTSYHIAQAEMQETETERRNKEAELTEHWESAVHLLDSQQFDAAILAFEAFNGTEYEKQAQLKIIEASNLAATQIRKDAASLFIRASKTGEFDKKKGLLVASYNLLNEILDKYPQTDLRDKVNQNIAILEEQIRKFDPALLDELQGKNSSLETSGQDRTPLPQELR